MRDTYAFTDFLKAINAWEKHKSEYLQRLEQARQPKPQEQEIQSYRNIWIEGHMEALANAQEQQPEGGAVTK